MADEERNNPLDALAQQAAEMDQAIEALKEVGNMGGSVYQGLVQNGLSPFHAAIVIGTALQAVFINQEQQKGDDV